MYFVTMKRPGYCMFSVSPTERFGIGLLDDQKRIHLLERDGAEWVVRDERPVAEHSHTDVMLRLGRVPEPASLAEFVRVALGG